MGENNTGNNTGNKKDNPSSGTCTHYCDRSKSCLVGYCKMGYGVNDRSCKKNGKIHDIFRERNVTNFEFMKNQFTE